MFDTIIAIGTVAIQLLVLVTIIAWIAKAPFATWVARNSSWLLKIIFVGAALGSLTYEFVFGFEPCVLCWYQRIAIFSIAILLFTANLTKSALLRLQILILSSAGLAIALFHNYISIFPESGATVCGATSVSCTILYVFQFGYITIPMMSATILLAGLIFTLLASRYPQDQIA
jgi:disulfide bond formation protein DsbB